MAGPVPMFTAVTSSSRQLLLLLRCISFAKMAQVRISAEGIRFSTEEGSAMEAFIFLEKAFFSSYTYRPPPPSSSQDDAPATPIFEINLTSLLETLSIFTLSDPNAAKKPGEYDSFAAHRLNRHAGINAFSHQALGMSGICRFTYEGDGSPLGIHMSESGVTTTCDLTTYGADSTEEIPFDREAIALKTIMRSSVLLEAISELSSMNPTSLAILASPSSRSTSSNLSLQASGALGSLAVDFTTDPSSDAPLLETFHCPSRVNATFKFSLIKSAQRAMGAANKVSMRLDEEGVLSLQFLVEVEAGSAGGEGVAFVDFRVVPLVEGEAEGINGLDGESTDEE
ncbi:Rad1/Rec1/Rad17 [Neohortaea acidophila]|uniref:Rad1/Rec1/Rad17 n=1 Tax=Neohortaea acidophila TaxID=245834 RepID=A0A6A6PVE5_9PEZI|nr:Rad1/Rec1/Rad17 [Neohortaea acidophila]KAF2483237.1 Rad1/Rec1/Rad17 [Neohortaea acidophila]